MPKEKWTNIPDGMEFRGQAGKLKVTKSDVEEKPYSLLEYQKGIGYVWQDRYTKRTLNNWLSDNGYPAIP